MAARSTLLVERVVRGYHVYKTELTPESESYIAIAIASVDFLGHSLFVPAVVRLPYLVRFRDC